MKTTLDITDLIFYGKNHRQWNFDGAAIHINCFDSDIREVEQIIKFPYCKNQTSGSHWILYTLRSQYHEIVNNMDPNYELKIIHGQEYGLAEISVDPKVLDDLKLLLKLSL